MMAHKSIKNYLWLSWLLPMVCTVLGSCALAFGLSYLDFLNYRRSEQNRLAEIAPTISRRVMAELLLGDQGRAIPVIEQLKSEYMLNKLEVQNVKGSQQLAAIQFLSEVILKEGRAYVLMERKMPTFFSFVQLRNFLLALLPTFLMAFSGFFLQKRFLRTHLIQPIESLADISTGEKSINTDWPIEIQTIARKLIESFSNREQAIFGQVARGIIHDIRTNIHSIQTATQLVVSAPDEISRVQRLEKLLSASARNIPKIKSILDLSLDSSREICMNPQVSNIASVVEQAIGNLEEIGRMKYVEIENCINDSFMIKHDPIQMERVLTNIIKNAIEASEEPTSPKKVKVSANVDSNGLNIEIEDSGKGVANKNTIFRLLKSSKTHGVGLGLFVSRKIVEAHEGELFVGDSQYLGGAKFSIRLPLGGRL